MRRKRGQERRLPCQPPCSGRRARPGHAAQLPAQEQGSRGAGISVRRPVPCASSQPHTAPAGHAFGLPKAVRCLLAPHACCTAGHWSARGRVASQATS